MRKSRAYRATSVKQVSVERVLEGRPAGTVHFGLDVGKEEIYAVMRWSGGTFGRPWKALNPSAVDMLVEILGKISTCLHFSRRVGQGDCTITHRPQRTCSRYSSSQAAARRLFLIPTLRV
jgi:hypothetical protein